MTEKHGEAEHHISAANHHRQAALYHREASKHYQAGKDFGHAAHMALAAHGHALKAIWHGNEAQQRHEDFGVPAPESPQSASDDNLNVAEHHAAATADHEQAAQHHSQAAEHFEKNDYTKAAYEANIAHGYARHSLFHGDEAAKHHVEHYGKAGPTAEIL